MDGTVKFPEKPFLCRSKYNLIETVGKHEKIF